MQLRFKHTYILLILAGVLVACGQTKYVPEGKYLLKKNVVYQSGDKLDKDKLKEVLRQQPNYKQFGIKWKLLAYNTVDSAKVADKRIRKNEQLRIQNQQRRERQNRINQRRIERARKQGKTYYTQRMISLKDTVNPRMFFGEWYKYKIGRPPVVFDSLLYNKSLEQLAEYLKTKGYYFGKVDGYVSYKSNRKAIVNYSLVTGNGYTIDSVYFVSDNPSISGAYRRYLKENPEEELTGKPFDTEELGDYRSQVASYMRDNAIYGFSANHIRYHVYRDESTMTVKLGVIFQDRLVRSEENRDSLVALKHNVTLVRNVFFHISDTLMYKGSFKKKMEALGLNLHEGQYFRMMDTMRYEKIKDRKGPDLDPKRMATFIFNGELFVSPELIELQNYLEETNYYKERYAVRTYERLLSLGLFQSIKTEIIEIRGTNKVDVHYYLVPAKRQGFGVEPKATNSNGFLGVSASMSYTNKNLFRGGERLTFDISGGFESQPPVFDETVDGQQIQTAGRSFNTFEIGPSLKLEIPGLFPFKPALLSKRHKPVTAISTAYNFQRRDAFSRGTFQMNYLWEFYVDNTQLFRVGLPGASVVKFVNMRKTEEFEQLLTELDDLFLLNSYSDQFIWQDWKFSFEYSLAGIDNARTDRTQLYLKSIVDPAGNLLALFREYQDTLSTGEYTIFGMRYAQFARLDNELIVSHPFRKEKGIHFKLNVGGGLPYGNSKNSLPYDYSFFAGGANDNRGWRARALGPGVYKYYLNNERTATQIGDLRFGSSAEFRFPFNSLFKGAVFVDAGNIWTIKEDKNREGGQFTGNWYKQLAVSAGFGLRLDLDFFILRFDLGIPIRNPSLPRGARWIFQPRGAYYIEGFNTYGANYMTELPAPFIPQLHFGIGYPF